MLENSQCFDSLIGLNMLDSCRFFKYLFHDILINLKNDMFKFLRWKYVFLHINSASFLSF